MLFAAFGDGTGAHAYSRGAGVAEACLTAVLFGRLLLSPVPARVLRAGRTTPYPTPPHDREVRQGGAADAPSAGGGREKWGAMVEAERMRG
ncbi:hypothetical protein ACWEQ8_31510 [Streptomyces noursei]